MDAISRLAALYAVDALTAKVETLEKTDIPLADKLSASKEQSEENRVYFKQHATDIKKAAQELRALSKHLLATSYDPKGR